MRSADVNDDVPRYRIKLAKHREKQILIEAREAVKSIQRLPIVYKILPSLIPQNKEVKQ